MTKAGYQVILDESDQIAGIYPKDSEGKVKDISQSIPFIPEYRSLFGVKVIDMTLQEFEKKRGIDLWHQRLGHVSKETILRSKEATTGMEGLKGKGETCVSCMIGKSRREHYPDPLSNDQLETMEKVSWDIIPAGTTSVEGYNYAALGTDVGPSSG